MTKLKIQFDAVENETPVPRAQFGYISALTTHGIGPNPYI